jgi:hypothetical protein
MVPLTAKSGRDGEFMKIKALTLWEPWAILVVGGYKHWETRSWSTYYRGPLAIHAARQEPAECERLWLVEYFSNPLHEMGYTGTAAHYLLPRGVIVGWVNLVDVLPTRLVGGYVGASEYALGDYSPGRFAWCLKEPYRLDIPMRASGRQGLWDWAVPTEFERHFLAANGEKRQ